MACWDIVVAAVELDVWVRPISWAVTGDAGKVIWIQGSMMEECKKEGCGVNICGQVDESGLMRYSLSFGKHQQVEPNCQWMKRETAFDTPKPERYQ